MSKHANYQTADANMETLESKLRQLFNAQQEAFFSRERYTLEERLRALKTLGRLIKERRHALCQAEQMDFQRKSAEEIMLTEIVPLLEHIRYVRAKLASWMQPKKRTMPLYFKPGRIVVQHEPLGCVGIIAPWNYPIILALSPLIDALAAGNHAMIKLSEHSPYTSGEIAELLLAGYAPEQVNTVTGDADTAKAFTDLPFDHLLYTGSTLIGKEVMSRAAKNLTPVTLELGGKSPCILGTSHQFELSVKKIAFGKCLNAGQTCIAPDVLFCPENKLEGFAAAFFAAVANMYPGKLDESDYTSIIHKEHFTRLTSLLAQTPKDAIKTYCATSEQMVEKRCFPPSLVINPLQTNRLWQEEIFGPILVVKTYSAFEEITAELRDWPSPLAIYIFSDEPQEIDFIKRHSQSGSICVNETLIQYGINDAPFGGVGASGFGRYHAHDGFKTFSNPRTIVEKPNSGLSQLLHPPFGGTIQRLAMRVFMR